MIANFTPIDKLPRVFFHARELRLAPRANSEERGTGFEPATTSLEGWCSATELPPHINARGLEPFLIERPLRGLLSTTRPTTRSSRNRFMVPGNNPVGQGAPTSFHRPRRNRCAVVRRIAVHVDSASSTRELHSTRGCLHGAKPPQHRCGAESKWAGRDSNPRRREPTDLQSAPFGRLGTCPFRGKPQASGASARTLGPSIGAGGRTCTDNRLFTKQVLYC
jgi:hypothetical protein